MHCFKRVITILLLDSMDPGGFLAYICLPFCQQLGHSSLHISLLLFPPFLFSSLLTLFNLLFIFTSWMKLNTEVLLISVIGRYKIKQEDSMSMTSNEHLVFTSVLKA